MSSEERRVVRAGLWHVVKGAKPYHVILALEARIHTRERWILGSSPRMTWCL